MMTRWMQYGLKSMLAGTLLLCCVSYADIWGIKGTDGNVPRWTLFHLDANYNLTVIGDVIHDGAPLKVDGLAYHPQRGLFAFAQDGEYQGPGSRTCNHSYLVQIDPETAVATPFGPLLEGQFAAAEFDPAGNLWAIDSKNKRLVRVDFEFGTIQAEIPIQIGEIATPYITGLTFDACGRAYALFEGRYFYSIDLDNGTLELLHTDNRGEEGPCEFGIGNRVAMTDICISGSGLDSLFASESNNCDDIYRYDLQNSWNRHLVISHYLPEFNSGTGDLAAWADPLLCQECNQHNGDINSDGCVDDGDLLEVLFAFGLAGQNLGRVDVNCDEVVDDGDLLIVLFNFGSGC